VPYLGLPHEHGACLDRNADLITRAETFAVEGRR
jgi:hypothetical protein